jgi:hypothetical protein
MKFTKRIRASIAACAHFIEDLIIEQSKQGISMLFSVQGLTLLPNAYRKLLPDFKYLKLTNPAPKPGNNTD